MSQGKKYRIAVLPGDGVGPEVTREALKVLDAASRRFGFSFECTEALAGGAAIDATGEPLPDATLRLCKASDAVLFGAVGGTKWDTLPIPTTPEYAIIDLRRHLRCFANLRYVRTYLSLAGILPIRKHLVADGVDILLVRELSEDIYYGKPKFREKHDGIERAVDTAEYTSPAIERIAKLALGLALRRRKKVSVISKPNVLETSKLFKDVCFKVAREFPMIEVEHEIVDAATMKLIMHPSEFDVLLTTNQFGDILGDEIAVLAGSLGLIPSAAFGEEGIALYEPVHGSAPDLAGRNIANPTATILCVSLMLRNSFQMEEAAVAIEAAVESALDRGIRTVDVCEAGTPAASTSEFGSLVAQGVAKS